MQTTRPASDNSLTMGRYPVRMAVVDMDRPPAWWPEQAADHMTAAEARTFAGTDGERLRRDINCGHHASFGHLVTLSCGRNQQPPANVLCGLSSGPVSLLTTPVSAGYSQNPISVYYCRQAAHHLPFAEAVLGICCPSGPQVRLLTGVACKHLDSPSKCHSMKSGHNAWVVQGRGERQPGGVHRGGDQHALGRARDVPVRARRAGCAQGDACVAAHGHAQHLVRRLAGML